MSREIIQVEQKVPLLKGLPLSVQHLFAMFGASVLVPILFNTWAGKVVVDPALVLLMNGVGTLLYLVICRGKAPAFLGSSFAFLAPTATCIGLATKAGLDPQLGFQHALGGFIVAGAVFALVALVVHFAGRAWIRIILPPAVMGPVVALIGLELAPVAVGNAFYQNGTMASGVIVPAHVLVALVSLTTVLVGSLVFRGFLAAIPVLIGVTTGYVSAVLLNIWVPGSIDFAPLREAQWITFPHPVWPVFNWGAILVILPAALVVISEHIGHLYVTGNIVGRDLFKEPGLPRSLFSDGISTMISGLSGSCPTTTYGENMGVMAITKVYSVWVIGGAAVISIVMAFLGHVSGAIRTLPTPVIGGISMVLFGVIAASGFRVLVEARVVYAKSRNLVLSAIVLMVGISGLSVNVGQTQLKGMVLGTFVGMTLGVVVWILDRMDWTAERPDVDAL